MQAQPRSGRASRPSNWRRRLPIRRWAPRHHQSRSRALLGAATRGSEIHLHPRADRLGQRSVSFPRAARLSRHRWRRRAWFRPRHGCRRGPGVAWLRSYSDDDHRRRRFHARRDRALDGGALSHSGAGHRFQQSLELQRRGPPGSGRARTRAPGREQMDRHAAQRSERRSCRWRALKASRRRDQSKRSATCVPRSKKRSPPSRMAVRISSTLSSNLATQPC